MKITKLTRTAALFVAIATFTVTSSKALTTIQVAEIKKTVLGVPVPEMPAKAAELVQKAEKKDRQAVGVTAVRAVVLKHRAAAPLVISAVSKAEPDIAPAVALAAAEIATDQAPVIARAAAVSAPNQAPQIITILTASAPSQGPAITASVNSANTRGSATSGGNSGGRVTLSSTPIDPVNGGFGNGLGFPITPPGKPGDSEVIYNTPPQ